MSQCRRLALLFVSLLCMACETKSAPAAPLDFEPMDPPGEQLGAEDGVDAGEAPGADPGDDDAPSDGNDAMTFMLAAEVGEVPGLEGIFAASYVTLAPLSNVRDFTVAVRYSHIGDNRERKIVFGNGGRFYYFGSKGLMRAIRDAPDWTPPGGKRTYGYWTFEADPELNDQVVSWNKPRSNCGAQRLFTDPESGQIIVESSCGGEFRYSYLSGGELPVHAGKKVFQVGLRGQFLYTDRTMRNSQGDLVTLAPHPVTNDDTYKSGTFTPRAEGGFWHVDRGRYGMGFAVVREDGVEEVGTIYNEEFENPEVRLGNLACWALVDGDALCCAAPSLPDDGAHYVVRLFRDGTAPAVLYPPCYPSMECANDFRFRVAVPRVGNAFNPPGFSY